MKPKVKDILNKIIERFKSGDIDIKKTRALLDDPGGLSCF